MGHCTVLIGTQTDHRQCGLPCSGYICLQHRRFEGTLPFEPWQIGQTHGPGPRKRTSRPEQVRDNGK